MREWEGQDAPTASCWSLQAGTAPPAAHQHLAMAGQPCSAHRGSLEELLKTPPLPDTLQLFRPCVPSQMALPHPPADRGQAELSSGSHAPMLPTARAAEWGAGSGEWGAVSPVCPVKREGHSWRDWPCLPSRAEVARMLLTRKLSQNDMQAKEEVYL